MKTEKLVRLIANEGKKITDKNRTLALDRILVQADKAKNYEEVEQAEVQHILDEEEAKRALHAHEKPTAE